MEKNSLIKKFLSFSMGGYISLIIGFFTIPITTRIISLEQYGIASIIELTVQVLVIMTSLSMEQSFVRFFYEEEETNRSSLLYMSLKPFFVLGLVVAVLIFIFRNHIFLYLINKKENYMWLYLICTIFFRTLNLFSFLVIRMKQRAKLFSFFTASIKLIEFIFILVLFNFLGNSYKTLIFASLIANIIVGILSVLVEKKIWNLKGFYSRKKCNTNFKELIYFSLPLILTMALNWIFASLDKITIKIFKDLNEVGIYSGAFKIVSILTVVQSGFNSFWTPISLEHYKNNPEDTAFYKKANDYLSLIFFLFGISILLFRDIIGFILGPQFYHSIFVMPTLVLVPIMYLLSETTMLGIGFKKKTKYFFYVSVISSISNLIGNLILVPYLGARGAAISTGIAYIIFFSSRTYYSIKLINFGFNLKRIYTVTFLILFYAIYLTFYNNLLVTIGIGIFIYIFTIIIYLPVVREIYNIYIKR